MQDSCWSRAIKEEKRKKQMELIYSNKRSSRLSADSENKINMRGAPILLETRRRALKKIVGQGWGAPKILYTVFSRIRAALD